ncbi:hypothetical protein EON82_22875, partial [bacterium]
MVLATRLGWRGVCTVKSGIVKAMSALIALLALACAAPTDRTGGGALAQTPVQKHGRLQVRGNRIVGKDGKPASLAGNSFFWSQWMPRFYNAGAVKWLKDDWKAGVVRVAVGVTQDGALGHPEAEIARASAVIDAAIKEGLYVLIDWHDHDAHRHEAQATDFFQKMARKYGGYDNVVYELW